MATSEKSVFATLNAVNVNDNTDTKNGLTYLSWACAWAEVKKKYPDAQYKVFETESGCIYFTDGRTCWVKVSVTIDGLEHIEILPIMDFKNKAIPLNAVTSVDANKSIQRAITKACARHGLGLYIYAGEDLPEDEHADQDKEKQQQKQEDATQHVTCAFCGKPITGGKVNGKTVTALAVMDKSMEVYGELFCYPCMVKKADEKANAAKGNEEC